jgi:hypothetical protein
VHVARVRHAHQVVFAPMQLLRHERCMLHGAVQALCFNA